LSLKTCRVRWRCVGLSGGAGYSAACAARVCCCGRRRSVGADGDAGATSAPVAASSGAAPFFQLVFNDVGKRSDQELEKMVRNAVRDAMASTRKTNRGSFRDRE
jgi:hypothetical protein